MFCTATEIPATSFCCAPISRRRAVIYFRFKVKAASKGTVLDQCFTAPLLLNSDTDDLTGSAYLYSGESTDTHAPPGPQALAGCCFN